MAFSHLLLTRFNIRRDPQHAPPSYEWTERRLALFEQYCLPSVRAQTTQDFRWLVYLDDETPDNIRDRLVSYGVPNLALLNVHDFMSTYHAQMAKYVHEDYLITTRLDNDDAIGAHHLQRVQEFFDYQARSFLSFTDGYVLDHPRKKLYWTRHLSNPFVSLIERSQGFVSVWCAEHNRIVEHGPVLQQPGQRNWMMVVHENNVSNYIPLHLQRVPLTHLAGEFSEVAPTWGHGWFPEQVAASIENQTRYLKRAMRKLHRIVKI